MCVVQQTKYPKMDYGQGNRAWNPGKRDEVYQQVEKARGDAGFAAGFAADILFGKNNSWFTYETPKGPHRSSEEDRGSDTPRAPRLVEKHSKRGNALYNENTLNASKSWVTQAFGAPAVRDESGNWYGAKVLVGQGNDGYGFLRGDRITDANAVRLLNEGHYAFSAKGYDGSEVYVPWAGGFEPTKAGGGRPEAGNAKKDVARGAVERDMVTAGTARPDNVIAGGDARTLLGGTAENLKKTLLGGTK